MRMRTGQRAAIDHQRIRELEQQVRNQQLTIRELALPNTQGDDESVQYDEPRPIRTYESDIELGKKYRVSRHGIEGYATAVTFHENACERVALEYMEDGKLVAVSYDAVELEDAETGVQAKSEKTGGPDRPNAMRTRF